MERGATSSRAFVRVVIVALEAEAEGSRLDAPF